jgi:4-amino-4-deoxy-L-arabinose transferase-like glycosyltransferase
VLYFDSGTLQAKAAVLGIGHPTGYPTFIILGNLFTHLPLGDPAYRVNLSSAAYGALAALMVYLTSLRLVGRNFVSVVASALGALAFAATPLLWSQSVVTEVYTLNALLVAATFYALLLWRDSRKEWHLLLAGLLTGLSVTAHMTSGLLIPAGILFVLAANCGVLRRPRLLAKGALSVLLGLSPYLYLPLRDSMNPPMDYGRASQLEGFLFLITGGNFRGQMLAYGPQQIPDRIGMYTSHLLQQFPSLLLAAALVGLIALARRDLYALVLLGSFLFTYLAYTLEYSISDIQPYFIPTYLILSLFIASGIGWLLENLLDLPGPSPAYSGAFALLVAALIAFSTQANYSEIDQSDNYTARNNVETVAENAEEGSTMLAGRKLAALQYMQTVEERRRDLELVMINSQNLAPRAHAAAEEGSAYILADPDSPPDLEGLRISHVEDALYRISPTGG